MFWLWRNRGYEGDMKKSLPDTLYAIYQPPFILKAKSFSVFCILFTNLHSLIILPSEHGCI